MRQKQQDAFPFVVDESSDVPLWVQLRQRIMHLISTGYFKPGDKLPTVRGLAQEVSINYNTVNKAYLSLVSDGILDDCISACRDLGLSLEDIQQHMTRRILQLQKAQAGGESCGEGARIVRVDVHQGAANAQTGA